MMEESLGKYFVGVGVDLTDVKTGMQQGISVVQSGTKQMKKDLEEFGGSAMKVGAVISSIGVTLGLALKKPIEMGMEAVESENLFEVSMGEMAGAARDFSETLRKEFGLNAYEVRRQTGLYNTMAVSLGLNKKAALEMSEGITKLGYDMASFYNVKPEEALDDLRAIFSGEIEPMKKYGVVINETTIKNWALTQGIIQQGRELTEAQKVTARYNVVLAETTKAQGDLARTIDSPTNQLRVMREEVKQAAIDLGMAFLPTVNSFFKALKPLVDGLTKLVQAFGKLPEWVRNATAAFVAILAISGPLILSIGAIASAMAALGVSFTPFLIGGAIIAGIVALISWIGKLREEAELARMDVDKATNLDKLEQEQKRLEKMLAEHEKIIKPYREQDKKYHYGGATKSWMDSYEHEIDDISTRLGKVKERIKSLTTSDTTTTTNSGLNFGNTVIDKSAYEEAKAAYEADAAVYGTTLQKKISLYHQYLDNVRKTAKEESDYKKGLNELEAEDTQQKFQIHQIERDAEVNHTKSTIQQEIDLIRYRASIGEITAQEELQQVIEANQQKYEAERALLVEKATLMQDDVVQHAQILSQIQALDDQYNTQHLNDVRQLAQQQLSVWTNMVDSIKGLSDQLYNSLVEGTFTWQGAINAITKNIVKYFYDMGINIVANWIKSLILKQTATQTNATVETGIEKLKYLGSAAMGASAASTMTGVSAAAFEAVLAQMTAIATAIASIPYAGPEMAAPMFAGIAAAQGTLAGSTIAANAGITSITAGGVGFASFDIGAWSIPQDQMAIVHKGETILPKPFAEEFREKGNVGGGSGGDVINLYCNDAKSSYEWLKDNKGALVKVIKDAKREFQFST